MARPIGLPAQPTADDSDGEEDMSRQFLPPINRAMKVLDRSFFRKSVPTSAARIFNPRDIARVRKECAPDLLQVRRVELMPPDPLNTRSKLLLLRPEVKFDDLSTASAATQALVHANVMELVPYTLHMDYSHWGYDELVRTILPADLLDDAPGAFSQAGHLAHVNLRAAYLPYKHLLAQLILDKNPAIRTVVNKIEDVGAHSVFRTFPMEVLAGPADTVVTVKESNCSFVFDFAKVYWNTRLAHEHERLIARFSPGEAVCDVMAGVGPFAVPAGKKGVFVWANDLNPDSYAALTLNIARNKVAPFVRPYNVDGRLFIRQSIRALHAPPDSAPAVVVVPLPPAKKGRHSQQQPRVVPLPAAFAHFVMNLPASAVEFLDAFRGAYQGLEHLFAGGGGDSTSTSASSGGDGGGGSSSSNNSNSSGTLQLPLIHVHTFHRETPERGEGFAKQDIVAAISHHLGCSVDAQQVDLHAVRRVAPSKAMYCACFRLPAQAAFASC